MSNPLLAQKQDSTTWHSGVNVLDDAAGVYDGVSSGSWIEGGIAALGTGLDLLTMAMNPVGTLISYGLNWLIEHVKPLQDALNLLAGDADQIAAYSGTWRNIATAVRKAAGDLAATAAKDTANWAGQAADTYRAALRNKIDHLGAAATCAETIGTVVQIVGVLTGAVRAMVRDMVTQAVGDFIQDALEEVCSLGLGTPVVVAQVVEQVSAWLEKIGALIKKLVNSVEKLRPMMSKLEEIFGSIKKVMAELHGRPGESGPHAPEEGATHASSAGHVPGDGETHASSTGDGHGGDPGANDGQGLYSRVPEGEKPKPWPPERRDPRLDYWDGPGESGALKVSPENLKVIQEKYGIEIQPGARVGINKGLRGAYGETVPTPRGARIDIAPQAFVNEEQLARTLYHENVHAGQLAGNGGRYPAAAGHAAWEDAAHEADQQWWDDHPLNREQAN
ncbi:hypothetical protein AMES_5482 [Amycolatopsis mediterranei S699]|uniref:Rhs protein n=2 Tax=Amycolatopsis mediterranei TaxID=33910 RepID=A0A0H3DAM8_AMYMU|nr:hypothetical protein [Amycolatopsis mediterranei]ADJ47307.1 conserved hypothetical protein [Amycolatopsis mediterranei U32]AEK44135.1 hypothetical protein RAM_28290 [Amycolatopsis mediterranei S699]AFO79018.1 hypothetical protein AMES_5482 [Amycolatopsis mediterranei S699]AGT86146.1 hypothetical protein B737_5482 [Amycolatopsis mediterranei RB]KDO12506.1 hypothetical protein DV26_02350 [Amycolatopsis mediterranei]